MVTRVTHLVACGCTEGCATVVRHVLSELALRAVTDNVSSHNGPSTSAHLSGNLASNVRNAHSPMKCMKQVSATIGVCM